jgi:DNA-binding MarR family transcriptional regulator
MFIPKALPYGEALDESTMNQLLDRKSPATTARFTAKQGQYLAFIWAYSQINRRAPAEADFQRYFKVTAPSVHQMLKTLDQLRLIEKQPGVARSIQLLVPPQELPILGIEQTVIINATGH